MLGERQGKRVRQRSVNSGSHKQEANFPIVSCIDIILDAGNACGDW